ncbi:MAG: hypothetical protein LBN02_02410 [Oscillospiraceae bacterium]|jgi:hypothetical protein|nr:hypothetical protein [Oscillospiraceae bacterium]
MFLSLPALLDGLSRLQFNLLLLAIPCAVLALIVVVKFFPWYRRRLSYKRAVAEFKARHNGAVKIYYPLSELIQNDEQGAIYGRITVHKINGTEPLWFTDRADRRMIGRPRASGVSGFFAASGKNVIEAEYNETGTAVPNRRPIPESDFLLKNASTSSVGVKKYFATQEFDVRCDEPCVIVFDGDTNTFALLPLTDDTAAATA